MDEQFEKIYKETENFGRTQFVKEIQKQINENQKLKQALNEIKEYIESDEATLGEDYDGNTVYLREDWCADVILEIIEKVM